MTTSIRNAWKPNNHPNPNHSKETPVDAPHDSKSIIEIKAMTPEIAESIRRSGQAVVLNAPTPGDAALAARIFQKSVRGDQ